MGPILELLIWLRAKVLSFMCRWSIVKVYYEESLLFFSRVTELPSESVVCIPQCLFVRRQNWPEPLETRLHSSEMRGWDLRWCDMRGWDRAVWRQSRIKVIIPGLAGASRALLTSGHIPPPPGEMRFTSSSQVWGVLVPPAPPLASLLTWVCVSVALMTLHCTIRPRLPLYRHASTQLVPASLW